MVIFSTLASSFAEFAMAFKSELRGLKMSVLKQVVYGTTILLDATSPWLFVPTLLSAFADSLSDIIRALRCMKDGDVRF